METQQCWTRRFPCMAPCLPTFMQIYQSVQKLSIHTLRLKPVMLLRRFCSTVNYTTMINNPNPVLSKANAFTSQLRTPTISKWLKLWDQKLSRRGPPEWHHLPTKFHGNLPVGSKVINGGKTADLISLLSFLESRLKRDHPPRWYLHLVESTLLLGEGACVHQWTLKLCQWQHSCW